MEILPYTKTSCRELPETVEIRLFAIFKELNYRYGVTYMSYTFDRFNTVRYSFRTDSKWASLYHNQRIQGQSLIELCPLDIVSRNEKNRFILWDSYKHASQPRMYREIMGMREDIGLLHGLTLSTYFNHHHDAIAVATDDMKNDLATRLLSTEHTSALTQPLLACRREMSTSLIQSKSSS